MSLSAPFAQRAADTPDAVLLEPDRALRLGDLSDAFEALDRLIGGPEGGPMVVVCPQSLAGALVALYVLDRGVDAVLVPAEMTNLSAALEGLRFCARRLELGAPPAEARWFEHPERFLSVTALQPTATLPPGPPRLFLMTSGSMGQAKLVAHSHARLLSNALACAERFALGPADRVAMPVPLVHMYGLGACLIPAVLAGASVDVQANANLLRYMDRERVFDPNVAFMTPQLCDMMTRRRRTPRPHRLVVTAGAPISPERFAAFDETFGPLVNLYGSTEMGAVAVCGPSEPAARRASGLGPALAGMTLRVGEGDGRDEGELFCSADFGFLAYVDGEGQPLALAPEWFGTRDLAARRPDGVLQLRGRIDDAVNRDGRLVRLADVEARMQTLSGVAQVAVVKSGQEVRRGDGLAAFCTAAPDATLDPAALRVACESVLPTHAIPDSVTLLPQMPTLPSGKVDRKGLAAQLPKVGQNV